MTNIWIACDWHLWNKKIEPRHPYRSVSNLTKLAANYASDIQPRDIFIYLGDLCDPAVTDLKKLTSIVTSIPGYKVMCLGNHDTQDPAFYREIGFDEVCEIAIIGKVIFSHKPCIVPPDCINVHGHLHVRKLSTLGYQHVNAYDVNFNDRPTCLDDLLEKAIAQRDSDWTGAGLNHVAEKFEKYTSLENDTYTSIIDLTTFVDVLDRTGPVPVIDAPWYDAMNDSDVTSDISALDESWFVTQNDLRINFEQWAPGNPLWITGASGDGKSTLANKLANERHATIITTDVVLCRMGWSQEKFEDMMKNGANADSSAHNMVLASGPAIDYVMAHPELPRNAKDTNTRAFKSEITDPEMLKFCTWLMTELSTNPKYKNTLYIIEGCDICLMDPSIMSTKPLIIVGSSRVQSFIHRVRRDIDGKGRDVLPTIFKHLRKYNLQAKRLDDNKDIFRNAILSAMCETDTSMNEGLSTLPNCDLLTDILFVELNETSKKRAPSKESNWPAITAKASIKDEKINGKPAKSAVVEFFNDTEHKVGTAYIDNCDSEKPYLYRLEVLPRYRGKLYGNSIMRYLMQEYHPTEATVESDNAAGVYLYKKFGFETYDTFEDWHVTMLSMQTKDGKRINVECSSDGTVNESVITDAPNLYYRNVDKWVSGKHQILFITGASASGKSTLANAIAEESDAEIIHLDYISNTYKRGQEWFEKRRNQTKLSGHSDKPHILDFEYFDSHPDDPWGQISIDDEDANQKVLSNYIQWLYARISSDDKYKNTKFIIEGIQIALADSIVEFYRDKALIVVETPTLTAHVRKITRFIRAFKADKWDTEIPKLFKLITRVDWSIEGSKKVSKFKTKLLALTESIAQTHGLTKEDKTNISAKYGIRDVGQYSEVDEEEKAKEKQREKNGAEARLREKAEKRKKDLEKARRVHRRKAFVRRIKKCLPFQKKDDDKSKNESAEPIWESYKFELADKNLRFSDSMRLDETAKKDKEPLYPVYVMLTYSGSPMAAAIQAATQCKFSHSVVSFDSSMRNMYSFGSKSGVAPFGLGFIKEDIKSKTYQDSNVPYALYVVMYTKDEVALMKKRLDYFIKNSTKFTYDFGGLVKNFFGIADNPEYRWFCSRFVADILNAGRPSSHPYVVDPSLMRPEDFRSTSFATYVTGGMTAMYNQAEVDRITKRIINQERMRRELMSELEDEYGSVVNESVCSYDLDPFDIFQESVLNYQLAMIDEAALDNFIMYLKSFKVRFDKSGNVIITRREFDRLDQHFRYSLKMIKAYENAGNLEGVKDELCKIQYMIQLINQHYLANKTKGNAAAKSDVKKDMLDLRSVMLNVFQQHLKYVTTHEPKFNFQSYFDGSKYGKDAEIPKSVLTSIGGTVVTALN